MKRKKWSEAEEQTLLTKYSELLNSGALFKLKTREKKFKPIAEHVNSLHHQQDPASFPFRWTWRDVSIKIQNMRHQYLGVKQKIRTPNNGFDWKDGENHWENFLMYKEVFGDVELELKDMKDCSFNEIGVLGLGLGSEESDSEDEDDDVGDSGSKKRRFRVMGAEILGLQEMVLKREEKRRERDWGREEEMMEREQRRRQKEIEREIRDDENENSKMEERVMMWRKKEIETRLRLERELAEERQRRIKLEEKWEEEELEWRERSISIQLEHEKQMMQMHANQMQILGVMTRLMCQFFGVANDGLGSGLGTLPHQVLQNLQHPGGLEDSGKPDAASPSEFCRLWVKFFEAYWTTLTEKRLSQVAMLLEHIKTIIDSKAVEIFRFGYVLDSLQSSRYNL